MFLDHDARGLHTVGVTTRPSRERALQQARDLTADLGTRTESLRFLLRDRDDKYSDPFEAVFETEGLDAIKSAPQTPQMNAHCERILGSIRREVFDHVLVIGETHARQSLTPYQRHYNTHRPHQARNQLPPGGHEQPDKAHHPGIRRVLHTRILDGLTNEYRNAARPAATTSRAARTHLCP